MRGPSRRETAEVSDAPDSELESGMGVPKEEVRLMLDTLPEDSSYEDIQYHIYVKQKVEQGLEAAENGDLLDQDEIERRMSRWLGE